MTQERDAEDVERDDADGTTEDWLNYHHLHYFWRIAREGSLSRAADRLRVSHSTLSAQLRALEDFLGGELFERRGRRLFLTPLGEKVAAYGDDIYRLGRELVEVARGRAAGRRIGVRAGVVGDLPKTLVYRLLLPALALPDGGPVVVRQGALEGLLADLSSGLLHFVLSDEAPPDSGAHRVCAQHIAGSGILLFGTPKLVRAHGPGFPRGLEGAPLLVPTAPSSLRRQIDRWLVERGLHVRIEGEFDDAALMRVVGMHGHGLFPVRAALREEVESTGRVALVGRLDDLIDRYYVVTTEGGLRHPAVNAVIERSQQRLR